VPAQDRCKAFDQEDMAKIFGAPLFNELWGSHAWIIALACVTGARSQEIMALTEDRIARRSKSLAARLTEIL
jgi:hypothetical protein